MPLPIAKWDYVEKQWYRTGTIGVTQNSKNVVGTATHWDTSLIGNGSFFTADNGKSWYEVESVTDATHLILKTPYLEATAAGIPYAIAYNLMHSNTDLTYRIGWMMDKYVTFNRELITWLSGPANGGPAKDGKYPVTDMLGKTTMVYSAKALEDLAGGWFDLANDPNAAAWIAQMTAMRDEVKGYHGQVQTWHGQVNTWQARISTDVASATASQTAAATSANAAAASALTAQGHDTQAALSRAEADTAAAHAHASELAALKSADDAESAHLAAEAARDLSREWAINPLNIVVPGSGGEYSSYHWAQMAKTWATAASGATAAQAAAEAARDLALLHKDAAAVSETNAHDSEVAAKTAENAAEASEIAARNSENLAQKWAQAPQNTAITPGQYSAYHWAQQAMGAATGVAWPPDAAGALTNDGAGNLSWGSAAGGGAALPPDTEGFLHNDGAGTLAWLTAIDCGTF